MYVANIFQLCSLFFIVFITWKILTKYYDFQIIGPWPLALGRFFHRVPMSVFVSINVSNCPFSCNFFWGLSLAGLHKIFFVLYPNFQESNCLTECVKWNALKCAKSKYIMSYVFNLRIMSYVSCLITFVFYFLWFFSCLMSYL